MTDSLELSVPTVLIFVLPFTSLKKIFFYDYDCCFIVIMIIIIASSSSIIVVVIIIIIIIKSYYICALVVPFFPRDIYIITVECLLQYVQCDNQTLHLNNNTDNNNDNNNNNNNNAYIHTISEAQYP